MTDHLQVCLLPKKVLCLLAKLTLRWSQQWFGKAGELSPAAMKQFREHVRMNIKVFLIQFAGTDRRRAEN